jgi:hypothetical protein
LSRRFERKSANLEAIVIGVVLVVVVIAYLISRFM